MPLPIQPPAQPAQAVSVRIGEFTIQPTEQWYRVTLVHLDADGNEVSRTTCQGSLYAPDGAPRFPPELYTQIRDALYALAIADGCVTPADAP